MSKFADFITGFGAGRQMVKDYRAEKVRSELAEVGDAKEEITNGYSAEDGAQLEAAANAKDENGNPYYKVEAGPDGKYSVAPQNAPPPRAPNIGAGGPPPDGDPAAPAVQGQAMPAMPDRFTNTQPVQMQTKDRTQFLGKTYDQPLTDRQRDSARMQAMAGVYQKNGEAGQAIQLRQQASAADQAERQGALMELQIGQAQRAGERDKIADEQSGKMRDIDKAGGEWMQKRLANPDGTMRQATIDDHIAGSQLRAQKLVEAGLVDQAGQVLKENAAQSFAKIQMETAQRDQALGQVAVALQSGNTGPLVDFYNKFIPDGSTVTGITTNPKTGAVTINRQGVDGSPVAPTTIPSMDKAMAVLESFKNPMAVFQFSQAEQKMALDRKDSDLRAKSVGIQGAVAAANIRESDAKTREVTQRTADKKELGDIRVNLNAALESGDAKAEATARKQLATYNLQGKGGQSLSNEERKANFFLASGAAKTLEDAARMAHEKVQNSIGQDYRDIAKGSGGIATSEGDVERMMKQMHGDNWKAKMRGETGVQSGEVSFASDAAAEAAFKAGKFKAGDKITVGGKTGTWK